MLEGNLRVEGSMMDSEQCLRDYRLGVEYTYLKENAPAGVLLLPDASSIRIFHGTIFIRTGMYKGGIFRFDVKVPEAYNSEGTFPEVKFTPPIFNPLVDPQTGKMELLLNHELMKEWDPSKHFLSTALSCVKKIFHLQSEHILPGDAVPNESAREMFEGDRASFLREVSFTIERASAESINQKVSGDNCLRFSGPLPAHDFLRETVVGELLARREREQKQLLSGLDEGDSDLEDGSNDDERAKGSLGQNEDRLRRDSVSEARQTLTRVRASSATSSSSGTKGGGAFATPTASPQSPSPSSKSRRLRSFFDAPLGGSTDDDDGSPQSP